jgi:putative peptidoglycan lipid II flippase
MTSTHRPNGLERSDPGPLGPFPSENRRIARAAGLVAAVTLASRISGLLRDAVTGYYFGAGSTADAFFVAFRLPNLLRRFVGEGAMSVAFIPIFTEYLGRGAPAQAERALRVLVTGFSLIIAAVTVIGIALAPYWLALLAPGFSDQPEMALTLQLTRALFPYLLLISLVALLSGYLNALRHFFAPALAPILLNLAMIGCAVVLAPLLATPVFALVWGVLLGGVLQVLAQVVPLLRRGISLAPLWEPQHPALGRSLRLLAPSTVGAAAYQINVMLSTSLASLLAAGSVSALWYAGRIFEFPIGMVAVALGTAALPSFAEQAVRGAHAELRRSLTFALALTTSLAVPASLALIALARPITAVLLQHGAFGAEDVERTALALQAYAIGLWPLAVVRIVVPAFYAMRDVRTPVLAALVALLANAVASLALIGALPGQSGSGLANVVAALTRVVQVADFGHVGLALASSLAAAVNVAGLVAPLARRLGGLDLRPLAAALLRSVLASAPMAVIVHVAAAGLDWSTPGGTVVKAIWLAAIIAGGLVAFAVASLLVGGPEIERLRRTLAEKRRR